MHWKGAGCTTNLDYTEQTLWLLFLKCVDGLIHGMDAGWTDEKLPWRPGKELTVVLAFHESISTVDGHLHGYHRYSWNSGFWWLRREVRARLGMNGPNPLAGALGEKLGIVRRDTRLALEPAKAILPPSQ